MNRLAGVGLVLVGIGFGNAGHGDLTSAILWGFSGFTLIAVDSLRKS